MEQQETVERLTRRYGYTREVTERQIITLIFFYPNGMEATNLVDYSRHITVRTSMGHVSKRWNKADVTWVIPGSVDADLAAEFASVLVFASMEATRMDARSKLLNDRMDAFEGGA